MTLFLKRSTKYPQCPARGELLFYMSNIVERLRSPFLHV